MAQLQADAQPTDKPAANQAEVTLEGLFPKEDIAEIVAEEAKASPETKINKTETKAPEGEETQPEQDNQDTVEKVFIKGENGEDLEAPLEKVIQEALGDDTLQMVDGKVVVELVANGETKQVDIPKLKKWASMGINANRIIEKANNSIAIAENAIADSKRSSEMMAEQLANQKVAQIIQSLNMGVDPITGERLSEDKLAGARMTADQLNTYQLEERLKRLEADRLRDSQNLSQRERQQRDNVLKSEAQAKLETVYQPFTQYFKADGKTLDGLLTRFKEAVFGEVTKRTAEYRREIGPEPDITPDWVRDTAKGVAKEVFKDYYPLLNKPKPKQVSKPILQSKVVTGKVATKTPTRTLSWEQEKEQIEKELGYRK